MFPIYRLFVFVGLLGIISHTISQTLEWGDEFKSLYNYGYPGILGVENERIYLVQHYYSENAPNTTRIYVRYLTLELKHVMGKEIPIKAGLDKRVFLGMRLRPEGLCIFVADKEPQQNLVSLKAEIYDLETLELTETRILKSFPSKRMPAETDFAFYHSPDSPFFCIIWGNRQDEQKKTTEITFQVYDEKMNISWEKEISKFQPGKYFAPQNVNITETGDLILGGRLYHGDKVKKVTAQQTPNYIYQGIIYRNHGADSSLFSLDLGEKFITNTALFQNPEGKIICAGFYNQVDARDAWDQIYLGTYLSFIDTAQVEQAVEVADFSEVLRYNEKGETSIVDKNDGYKDYRFTNVLNTEEGFTHFFVKKGLSVSSVFSFDQEAKRTSAILFSHEKKEFVFAHQQDGNMYIAYLDKLPKSEQSPAGKKGLFFRKITEDGSSLESPFSLENQLIVRNIQKFPFPQYQFNEDTWLTLLAISSNKYQIGYLQFTLP